MASLGKTLHEWGEIIVQRIKDKITEKKLIASDGLLQNIKYSVKIFGKDYVMHVGFNSPADEYAPAMNDGAKYTNKMPPVDAIDNWLFRKGILPQAVRGRKPLKDKLKARKGLAWAIAKNIKKRGIIKRFGYKGSGFWDEAINEDLRKELTADIRKAVKRDIVIEFGDLKKEIKSHGN